MFVLICFQKTMYGANVIIFEGIMAFYNTEVLEVNNIFISY